ncbi:hypothetical protein EJ08DRAFT_699278 [Tothia fuscella]|uniref:YAG7-like dimerisation domain-containing protein n=1 Tax=Tothia fuscella TaxID=1048955 RepID=A0A9P4TWD8_9PEZI|nr:hypothetical protein EJ08DRAFT_699278 [Tothia fuscella]
MASVGQEGAPPTGLSKSALKKKAKAAELARAAEAPKERSDSQASLDVGGVNGGSDGGNESSAVKELQKQIRNVNKKLNLMHKVDGIMSAHPDKSLDELVSAKLINNDQKAQAQKKPILISQREALETQIEQYKKFEAEHAATFSQERSQLKSAHTKELDEVRDAVRKEVENEKEKEFKMRLLVFARFLKAAAERRGREEEEQTEEGKAFEGVLYGIYTGDAHAVECAEKLIEGVEEKVSDYTNTFDVTYARVKELSLQESPLPNDDPWADSTDTPITHHQDEDTSDLTITHATLTEQNDTRIPNGTSSPDSPGGPPNATFLGDAGNAAAEEQWDTKGPGEVAGMDESFEMVPRDPQEVENSGGSAPALAGSTQSWADETSAAAEVGETVQSGDGFQEVSGGNRGRGSRGGSRGSPPHRGGGGRGGARGGRGEFRGGRGRGEGGFRGEGRGRGRGAPRGGPRGESS